jgi:FAD binding domain/Berberine and berberine like
MATTAGLAGPARAELAGFDGVVIGPEDGAYDEARRVHNGMIDRRPGVILRPATAAAVAAAVGFARAHDVPLAVRGGGHSGPGFGVCDDGVVLDLGGLDSIEIDADARTATVGGGCTLGAIDAATARAGLHTPFGIIGTTGVGGLTLGGGIGHLARRHGLSIDNLLGADVVLADGTRVHASADEHPDLFWAIRGGGGNFGVVTSFEFRLHPLSTVIAGPTFWSLDDTAAVMRAYHEFIGQAPRELNGFFAFHTVPPVAPFPEHLHGRIVATVVWCYAGDDADAAATAIAPMLDVAEPLMHGAGPLPFAGLQGFFDALYPKGPVGYWRGDFVVDIPDEAIAAHAEHARRMPVGASTMHLYPIDGAVHDVAPEDTAWSRRDLRFAQVIYGVDPDPANAEAVTRWSGDYFDAVHPYTAGGAYLNFLMEDGGQERVRSTFGPNYDRLARIKAQYDPDNTFRANQNIRPQA